MFFSKIALVCLIGLVLCNDSIAKWNINTETLNPDDEKQVTECTKKMEKNPSDTLKKCMNQAQIKWHMNQPDGKRTQKDICCGSWDEMRCILTEAKTVCADIYGKVKELYNEVIKGTEILLDCKGELKFNGTECAKA